MKLNRFIILFQLIMFGKKYFNKKVESKVILLYTCTENK